MKPVLALDFDGVVCDSIDECLVTAVNAYNRFRNSSSSRIESPLQLDPDFVLRFRRLRYLVRPAREYWLLVDTLLTSDDEPDQSRFDIHARQLDEPLKQFEPIFFETRRAFRETNQSTWLSLHRLFPQFTNGWEQIRERCRVHIVTTKDKISVNTLLQNWEIEIPTENIWALASKPKDVLEIAARERCSSPDVMFVDDHPDHLKEVAAVGAQCYWASWGYTPNTVPSTGLFQPLLSLDDLDMLHAKTTEVSL